MNVDFKDTYVTGSRDIRNCHINVGTGKEVSIREVAEIIMKEIGFKGILLWDSSKPDGTMRKLTDVSKLHSFCLLYTSIRIETNLINNLKNK